MLCISVCQMATSGLAAIFGPSVPSTANHIQSISDTFHIPHIETRWDYSFERGDYAINIHPHPSSLSKVRSFTDIFHLFPKIRQRLSRTTITTTTTPAGGFFFAIISQIEEDFLKYFNGKTTLQEFRPLELLDMIPDLSLDIANP